MFQAIYAPYATVCVMLLFIITLPNDLIAQSSPKWTGFARFTSIKKDEHGISTWKMEANLVNDTGTATHSYSFSYNEKDRKDAGSCSVVGKTIMSGGYGEGTKFYGFWIGVPDCLGVSEKGHPLGMEATAIVVDGQTGDNPNIMSGSKVDKMENLGTVWTWEWHFVRSRDAELIVTPQNYDAWMPEPPKNSSKYGNILPVKLKVQSRRGGKADEKVNYFKLSLAATSKQPGITINMPLDKADEEPDLRFVEAEDVELLDAKGQSIKLKCRDGETGSVGLVSFDGGGWTTLTVEAILNDSTHLKGQLIKSGGEYEILIPKRDASSKIASAWLKQYSKMEDQSDEEVLPGNTNKGDGITAYEEYRGVISKGQFKRLNPSKMELAVERKEIQEKLFQGGLSLFEKATGIIVLPIYEDELEPGRVLNINSGYGHAQSQHAMRIRDDSLNVGIPGENQPAATLHKTPGMSIKVVIDIKQNKQIFESNKNSAITGKSKLPYSETDLINNTIAHELGHGVHLEHHGPPSGRTGPSLTASDRSRFKILGIDGTSVQIPNSGYNIKGSVGVAGCEASGDLICIMSYTSLYQWIVYTEPNSSKTVYRSVPLIAVGQTLCSSAKGTGINANGGFFGDATLGNCRAQIKVKD